jgi:ubiquinone/menaquinone biosynthesis C-methylase UbiE
MSDPLAGAEPPQIDAEAFTAFEAAGWERKAATYDRLFGQLTGRLVEPLLDAAHIGAGDRVLDVATGPGHVAGKAVDRGAAVIGVDIAPAMVALAQQSVPRAEFRVGNAELLPFADDAFDAVVGNFMIMHVPRPERAGSEFVRIMKPGGRLALTAWGARPQPLPRRVSRCDRRRGGVGTDRHSNRPAILPVLRRRRVLPVAE